MICVCGVESDADARVLQEAVQKIIRIKLQMGSNHQVGLARARGSQLVIEQEFTRNVDALVATVPGLLCSADHGDAVAFDSLLAHAARLFSAQQEMRNASSFRLLFIYRQVKQVRRRLFGASFAFGNPTMVVPVPTTLYKPERSLASVHQRPCLPFGYHLLAQRGIARDSPGEAVIYVSDQLAFTLLPHPACLRPTLRI